MPTCVFRRCGNFTPKTVGITYHAFPSNELRHIKWTSIVRRQRREEDWQPNNSSRICSVHFKEEDKYKSNKGMTLLKKSAIPVFEDPWRHYSRGVPASPNSLDGENISDLDWVFDRPEHVALEKQINKISIEKENLQRKNSNLNKKIRLLQRNAAGVNIIMRYLNKHKYITKEKLNALNLKPEIAILIKRLNLKRSRKKNRRQQYPPVMQKFDLKLNSYSPAAYDRKRGSMRRLLHPRFLIKCRENNTASPGFSTQVFDILKEKYVHSGKRLLCALITDEIPLRHHSKCSGKRTDSVVDFGDSTSSTIVATEAYLFLLVALNDSWTLPVGYFLAKGVTAQTRAHLITSCLSKCYHSGIDVAAVTFDGSRDNIAAANILGCNLNDPNNLRTTFKHPVCDTQVALFFDSCHMMELVRNTFKSKRLIFNDSEQGIKWSILCNLNKLRTNEQLNFTNRLTELHLNFRNEIMKVRLTTQLLSKSVANVLELSEQILVSSGINDKAATVEFIKYFNDLLDILNLRYSDIYYFKNPICPENSVEIFAFLDRVKQYILSLTLNTKTRSVFGDRNTIVVNRKQLVDCKCNTGFIGFLVNIGSLKHLYSSLVELKSTITYIPTHRLNQDHIEVLFGVDRKHGCDKRPSAVQFKEIYKKIINHIQLRNARTGNCTALKSIPILSSLSAVLNINQTCGRCGVLDVICDTSEQLKTSKSDEIAQKNADIFANMLNDIYSNEYIKYIVGYISGWITRKLVNVLKCEVCIDALFTREKMWFHKLISIRDMSGLCYCTENVFIVCLKAENIIKRFIKENDTYFMTNNDINGVKNGILKSFIDSNVFSNLHYHAMTQPPTYNHRLHLIRAIIDDYTDIRLRFTIKRSLYLRKNPKKVMENKLYLF